MKAFPLFLKIENEPVLLLGGGGAAEAKARLLLAAGADLTVVTETPSKTFQHWADQKALILTERTFQVADLEGIVLAVAADAPDEQSRWLYKEASQRGVPVNVVDQPALSSFVMPAVIDRSPVVIAISTFGAAPVLARRLRATIESLLPARLGSLADFAQRYRSAVKAQLTDFDSRRRFWERFFDGPVAAKVLAGEAHSAQTDMLADLNHQDALDAVSHPQGQLHQISVPNGDPDLLTLRDFRLLQSADLVLHEDDVDQPLLNMARRDARFVRLENGQDAGPLDQRFAPELAVGQTVIHLSAIAPVVGQAAAHPLADQRMSGANQLQQVRC